MVRQLLSLWRELREARPDPAVEFTRALDLVRCGDRTNAERRCERAVDTDPDHTEAWLLLAALRSERARSAAARAALERAVSNLESERDPAPEHLGAAANIAIELRETDTAGSLIDRAGSGAPGAADTWMRLAQALTRMGDIEEARIAFERALAVEPDHYGATNELGRLHLARGNLDAASACFSRAIEIDPDRHPAHVNLGALHLAKGWLSAAVDAFHEALRCEPNDPDTLNNLGNAFKEQGRIDEAIGHYRASLEGAPNFAEARSNLVFAELYSLSVSPHARFDSHREWARRHAPRATSPSRVSHSERDRPLRIGYVSPDLGEHPIGRFIAPVLELHDRESIEVVCYDDSLRTDTHRERLRAMGHRWRECATLSDAELVAAITGDGIDILVDLTGHTARHRLRVFATRPAPVQVSWIGYLHTTGLDAIDYLIADSSTVPSDSAERFTESVWRLPECFLCYGAPEDTPPVRNRDSLRPITFGCFNNLAKLNDEVFVAWSAILRRTPGSRLILKNGALADESTANRIAERLRLAGISLSRVELQSATPRPTYLDSYRAIDIALDPWPFSGGTISCDALWMGVPVVTWAGPSMAGRTTTSVLTALGLEELVADSPADYVDVAVALGSEKARIRTISDSLRERFAASRLGNPDAFTRSLEDAYREMWRCRRGESAGTITSMP